MGERKDVRLSECYVFDREDTNHASGCDCIFVLVVAAVVMVVAVLANR
jgi:hypothetical protein